MKSKRLWRHVAVSLIVAGPAGGFMFGLLNASDPDPNPVGRVFYACMMAVLTPFHAGFPPHNEIGAGQSFNVWPHIAISYLLIFSWFVYRDWKIDKKGSGKQSPIAGVVAAEMFAIAKHKQSFDQSRFVQRLRQLPDKSSSDADDV